MRSARSPDARARPYSYRCCWTTRRSTATGTSTPDHRRRSLEDPALTAARAKPAPRRERTTASRTPPTLGVTRADVVRRVARFRIAVRIRDDVLRELERDRHRAVVRDRVVV